MPDVLPLRSLGRNRPSGDDQRALTDSGKGASKTVAIGQFGEFFPVDGFCYSKVFLTAA